MAQKHDVSIVIKVFISEPRLKHGQTIKIETPMSRVNELKITSATDPVTVTPDTAAVITFVVRAPSPPLSSVLTIPQVGTQCRINNLIIEPLES